jgi:hypothetical protein
MKPLLWIIALTVLFSSGTAEAQEIAELTIRKAVEAAVPTGHTVSWLPVDHLTAGQLSAIVSEGNSVEVRDNDGALVATLLVLRTTCSTENPTGVYPHDYRRCGSIHGRDLQSIRETLINEGSFQVLEYAKNVIAEHEISFVASDTTTSFVVDSEYLSNAYGALCDGPNYNFQVWSTSTQFTQQIVAAILGKLADEKTLTFRNTKSKAVPSAFVKVAKLANGSADVVIRSSAPQLIELVGVEWTAGSTTPLVNRRAFNLAGPLDFVSLPLLSAAPPTEVEIQVLADNVAVDAILVSGNPFGHYSSSWYPFVTPGASSALTPAKERPESDRKSGASLNGAFVHLDCVLPSNSVCGAFIDLLPETGDPLDLSQYDFLSLETRRANAETQSQLEIKIETNSGRSFSKRFAFPDSWQTLSVHLDDLVGGEDWAIIGRQATRVTVAAVAGDTPTTSAFDFGNVRVQTSPRLVLHVIGNGSVAVSDTLQPCVGTCVIPLELGAAVALDARPGQGGTFMGWRNPSPCANSALVAVFGDSVCSAVFSQPISDAEHGPDAGSTMASDAGFSDSDASVLEPPIGDDDDTSEPTHSDDNSNDVELSSTKSDDSDPSEADDAEFNPTGATSDATIERAGGEVEEPNDEPLHEENKPSVELEPSPVDAGTLVTEIVTGSGARSKLADGGKGNTGSSRATRSDGGGCSLSAGSAPPALPLAALLMLGLGRRRTSRCERRHSQFPSTPPREAMPSDVSI